MYSKNFRSNFIRELNEFCQKNLNSILLTFIDIGPHQRESFIPIDSNKLLDCSLILTNDFAKSIRSLQDFKQNILTGLEYALEKENLYRIGLTVNTYVVSNFNTSIGGKELSIEIYLKNVEEEA